MIEFKLACVALPAKDLTSPRLAELLQQDSCKVYLDKDSKAPGAIYHAPLLHSLHHFQCGLGKEPQAIGIVLYMHKAQAGKSDSRVRKIQGLGVTD